MGRAEMTRAELILDAAVCIAAMALFPLALATAFVMAGCVS